MKRREGGKNETRRLLERNRRRLVLLRRRARAGGRRNVHEVPKQSERVVDESWFDVGSLGESGQDRGEASELFEVEGREGVFDSDGDCSSERET